MVETNPEPIDPAKQKEIYTKWKNAGMLLGKISTRNRELLIEFISDMEIGRNVSIEAKKGGRGYGRLNTIKSRMNVFFELYEQYTGCTDITTTTDKQLLHFFNEMREGRIISSWTKKPYKSIGGVVKEVRAFWNWYILRSKREGKIIQNIAEDVDRREEKPKFNYFTIEQLKILCNDAKFYYKTMMMFLFDSGIRAPTELMNVCVADLEWSEKEKCYLLTIKEETSKTFGRKIKLLLCSDILKQYVKQNNLHSKDYLFTKSPKIMNDYLRDHGFRYLGIGHKKPLATGRDKRYENWVYDGLTLYDFRHSSACYWLVRYKSESALKYRFGWKRGEMIHYYTELLGMKDTIHSEDLYVDITKTELEKEMSNLKTEMQVKDERHNAEVSELRKSLEKRQRYDHVFEKMFSNPKFKEFFLSNDLQL